MPVLPYDKMNMKPIEVKGGEHVSKAVVIGREEGWPDHTVRVFRLAPGGFTPRHSHDWEHVNYIIKGTGELRLGEKVQKVHEHDFAFVPANTEHQFRNAGDEDFEFICIVPNRGEY